LPRRPDLAAALVNLVAQTIALIAIDRGSRAQGCRRTVLVGHMLDLVSFQVIEQVGTYYAAELTRVESPGYATALGALLLAEAGL
jgi:hypothetical protein